MANLINPTFNMPDIVGNMREGQQYGRQLGIQQRQDADRSQLRNLSTGILAGDSGAFMQAAAIDPDAAMKIQGAGDNQLRRLEGGLDFLENALATQNPASINAAYQQVRPFLQRLTGTDGPEQWDESMRPGMEQVRAKIAMAKAGPGAIGGVQSTYVDDAGNRVAILRDGTTRVLGGNDAGANQQTLTIDIGGVPTQVTFDKRTGRYTNASLGPQQPAAPQAQQQTSPTAFTTSDGASIDISSVTDPLLREQITKNPAAFGMVPDNGSITIRDVDFNRPQTTQQVATPLVGRRAEDEEAAKVAARLAAENANFQNELDQTRQLEAVKGQASVDQAIQTERGKAQVEKEQAAPGAISTMEQAITSIDELLDSEDLGSILGWGSVNPLNRLPNSPARGLIARAEQISGQAFLAAFNQLKGGGAITEKEGAAATAAMARLDRSQSEKDYTRALKDLKEALEPALARNKAALARSPQASQGPSRVSNQSEYDALPSGSLYVDPQGNQRRKR